MDKTSETQDVPCFLGKHGFDFDMFFSYSHGDPRGEGKAPLKRWSKELYIALSQTLDVLVPEQPPRIFFDESVRPGDGLDKTAHLAPEVEEKVRASALFQVIMSPLYLQSPWCKSELDTFVEALPGKAKGVRGRVFIAKAMETEGIPWPPCLCDDRGNKTVGWEFHPRGAALPYGWYGGKWNGKLPDKEMEPALIELAMQVARRLRALDSELTGKTHAAELCNALEAGRAESIYLYGTSEEPAEWEAVCKAIDTLDIMVQPGEPEPPNLHQDPKRREKLDHLASHCDAMVLVGWDGPTLDLDLDVVGRQRRNLIASRYGKYLPCAVVDRSGTLSTEARIRNAKRFDIEWIDAKAVEWPGRIKDWLQESADKARQHYGLAGAAA
jgi:hypothetical protein